MPRCLYTTGASELKEFTLCPNRWYLQNIENIPQGSRAENCFYLAKHEMLIKLFGIELKYLHVNASRYGRAKLESLLKKEWKDTKRNVIEYMEIAPFTVDITPLEKMNPNFKKFSTHIKETELRVFDFSRGDYLEQPLKDLKNCVCARPDYIINARIGDSDKCFPFEVQGSALAAEEFPEAMAIQLATDRMCMAKTKKLNGFKNEGILDYGISAYLKDNEIIEEKVPLKGSEGIVTKTVVEIRRIRAEPNSVEIKKNKEACIVCPRAIKEACSKN